MKTMASAMVYLAATWGASANATSYLITAAGNYTQAGLVPYTLCVTAPAWPCTNYTSTQSVSGHFTVPTVLAADLDKVSIAGMVGAFSFTDGINTYASSDTHARVLVFSVTTDPGGNLSAAQISVQKWLPDTSPHNPGDRLSFFYIDGTAAYAVNNSLCDRLGTSSVGTVDSCNRFFMDSSHSEGHQAAVAYAFTPDANPAPIPTLSEWGMIILAGVLAMGGFVGMRRGPAVGTIRTRV